MFYFIVLLPNMAWPFIAKAIWHQEITTGEVLANVLTVFCIGMLGYGISTSLNSRDVEILNGEVTKKIRDEVHCRHSYKCHCYETCSTDSQGHRSCTEHCSTCYDHDFDVDWDVHSNLGSWTIDTIDRQGLKEPPRWTVVKAGDPVSMTNSFENLVKASQSSLFNTEQVAKELAKYKGGFPGYPANVYDYYKHNKLVLVGLSLPKAETDKWNYLLANSAKKLGPKWRANPLVVLVKGQPADYANALEMAWLGGKLNDVVLVVGTDTGKDVKWARAFSWSTEPMIEVTMRDSVLELTSLTPEGVVAAFDKNVPKNFHKRSKKSFEYLKDEVQPTPAAMVWTFIFCLLANIGLTIFFHKEQTLPGLREFFNIKGYRK